MKIFGAFLIVVASILFAFPVVATIYPDLVYSRLGSATPDHNWVANWYSGFGGAFVGAGAAIVFALWQSNHAEAKQRQAFFSMLKKEIQRNRERAHENVRTPGNGEELSDWALSIIDKNFHVFSKQDMETINDYRVAQNETIRKLKSGHKTYAVLAHDMSTAGQEKLTSSRDDLVEVWAAYQRECDTAIDKLPE